ncbi:hypothetical protein [Zunongwangia profunda]|uniref:hypothetical protein n=1 Tax=Zunongwangia profunda TaxID=398743 RepID=UPI00248F2152|nr:hypothetical protein [Zunongwangia profunda]|tara:strand:+ start:6369 stop:6650 length:282 start_codon:yes stop_codon:yes gene_type:complete
MNDLKELINLEDFQAMQKVRFRKALNEVFSEAFQLSKIEFEEEKLIHAKINTNEVLDKIQMDALSFHADSWELTYQISRSGAGIKIEFKENQK